MEVPLWLVGFDLVIAMSIFMTLWFGLGVYVKRIDVVDAAWGLGFIYAATLTLMLDGRFEYWQWLVLGFVAVWGLRLFLHVGVRLQSTEEDRRYGEYRKKWGERFFQKAYTNIFLLQGVLLVVVATPALAIIASPEAPLSLWAALGFNIWAFGIAFEALADYQLQRFVTKKAGRSPSEVMNKGLWKYSRHPNYFGEITAWWGAGIVAVSVGQWWGIIGPITITYLILKVSGIPPIEKRRKNDPKYKAYMQKTSVLIPLPPKS